MLRQGVVFAFASEEIIFRSKAKEDGMAYFDRNLFTIGAGYLFTDDIQLELSYVNEFVPRDDGNIINNAVSITLIFNNLLMKLGNLIAGEPKEPARDEWSLLLIIFFFFEEAVQLLLDCRFMQLKNICSDAFGTSHVYLYRDSLKFQQIIYVWRVYEISICMTVSCSM